MSVCGKPQSELRKTASKFAGSRICPKIETIYLSTVIPDGHPDS